MRLMCLILLIGAMPAAGQTGGRTGDLSFKIAVYGPADEIFIWWGHAALIVEYTRWNYSRVFDWGIFSYPSDNFLAEFLKNRVQYFCAGDRLDLDMYIGEDRDIAVYTLDLDEEGKEAVLAYAENNVLPENCYYAYHEFRDNCSTRIRDILDLGTGGRFRAWAAAVPGRFSYRQHIRRYTWFRPLADWFLDFLMGRDLDRPISAWEEMFLPVELARHALEFRRTGADGVERPLVRSVEVFNAAKNRPPILNAPLTLWPLHLGLGLAPAAFLLFVQNLRKSCPRAGRIILGAGQSLLGLFFGFAGCVLFFGRYFMANDYIRQNSTLLFINPLLLAAGPLGIMAALGRPRRYEAEKRLALLWAYVFAAGMVTVLARSIPGLNQQNQSAQASLLPSALVLGASGLRALAGRLRPDPFRPFSIRPHR